MIDELQDSLLGGVMPVRDDLEKELWGVVRTAFCRCFTKPHWIKVSKQLRIGINDLLEQQSPHVIAASLSDLAESLLQFVISRQKPYCLRKCSP